MYRITLTDAQRQELHRRTRQRDVLPSTRDRLEMVRLADAGWTIPQIARHLGIHEQTVRTWVKTFLAHGFDALPNKPRGGKHTALTAAMLADLATLLTTSQRTWTAPHLADWLAETHGLRLSPGRLRVHMKRAGLSYHRTARSLRQKQDPDAVAAYRAAVEPLKKKRRQA